MNKYILIIALATFFLLQSCQRPGGNSTGSEFMPDMGHSIAYEANYYNYYYNNTWGSEEEYYSFAQPRLPVKGTVARRSAKNISIPSVGDNTPYPYADTEEERTRAMAEVTNNPYPITDAGLAEGKELYNINCAICHGEKGDGNGYLVRDDGGVYPVQPAILTNDEFVAASNGRMYHSIMYGKNLMGSYKDKLAYEERWQVIHYVRSLQAKEKKLVYNQTSNTLNTIDKPAGVMQVAELHTDEPHHDEHGTHDMEHGKDHHDDHDHKKDHHDEDHGEHSHDGHDNH